MLNGSDVQRTTSITEGPALEVSTDTSRGLVSLAGELDREHSHHLLMALSALAGTAHEHWVVDTARVTFCDAGGLRTLAAASALAHDHGRQLVLDRPSRPLLRLVTLAGLDDRIDIRSAAGPQSTSAASAPWTDGRVDLDHTATS